MALLKGCLHGVPFIAIGHALNGGDSAAVSLNSEHAARLHAFSINQHGAGTAIRGITSDYGPNSAQVIAQEMNEEGPWFNGFLVGGAIDRDGDLVHGAPFAYKAVQLGMVQVRGL